MDKKERIKKKQEQRRRFRNSKNNLKRVDYKSRANNNLPGRKKERRAKEAIRLRHSLDVTSYQQASGNYEITHSDNRKVVVNSVNPHTEIRSLEYRMEGPQEGFEVHFRHYKKIREETPTKIERDFTKKEYREFNEILELIEPFIKGRFPNHSKDL